MARSRVTKLVVPVAGKGTRLYPLTLSTPKALVQVAGKPLLEYILEEAAASEFRDILLVVSPQHQADFERYIAEQKEKFKNLKFSIRTQNEAFGNGHAILEFQDMLEGEPFAVRFCDDLLLHHRPALASLKDVFETHGGSVFVVERVPKEAMRQYGVVAVKKEMAPLVYSLGSVVEKPSPEEVKEKNLSNLTVVGAYVLTPEILEHLKKASLVAPSLPDALPLTVGFHHELGIGGNIYGWEFPGTRLDCGTLSGLKKAEAHIAEISIPRQSGN